MSKTLTMAVGLVLIAAVSASADYVLPMMGGGQTTAPMKHVDVLFDGTNITLDMDDTADTPHLRPLVPPDEFDPTKPWRVLVDKAYNYQYAFNPGGFITLPAGSGIWVERLYQDAPLEVYVRPPMFTGGATWPRIFTADGERWQWTGAMQHNAYAVLDPLESVYTARYRVYIGNSTTGDPLAGYGSEDVTFVWTATPPSPGDANYDTYVDDVDASILGSHWLASSATWSMGDFNQDGSVNDKDVAILAAHWTGPPTENASVPEPTSLVFLLGGLLSLLAIRHW